MKKLLLFLSTMLTFHTVSSQTNVEQVGVLQYDRVLSDVWGYTAPDGTEYALVGLQDAVSIVSLADHSNPIELHRIPGGNSIWRDLKTYKDRAYITAQTASGLLSIDLSMLPDSIVYHEDLSFNGSHNIYVDEYGYGYLTDGTLKFLDLNGALDDVKIVGNCSRCDGHDIFVKDNILYSSSWSDLRIHDVTDKSNPIFLGSTTTTFRGTHNAWTSDNSQYIFTTDELTSAPITSFDISNPQEILKLDEYNVPNVTPHNVHVHNDYLVTSYYTKGVIILDGSRPENLILVSEYDTYPGEGPGYNGAWGAFPYFDSGHILVSDQTEGLFVLKPDYKRACWLEGVVQDASTQGVLNGVDITITSLQLNETTNASGEYKTGHHMAGEYTVTFSKGGYQTMSTVVNLSNGVLTNLDIQLEPLKGEFNYRITIQDRQGNPIENVTVDITNEIMSRALSSDSSGNILFENIFDGDYDICFTSWGYTFDTESNINVSENEGSKLVIANRGYADNFDKDLGWTSNFEGDQSERVKWEIGIPDSLNVLSRAYPNEDLPNDCGETCYLYANEGLINNIGTTTLQSPSFDLSDFNKPILSFYAWPYVRGVLEVNVFNGIDSISYFFTHTNREWEEFLADVASQIELTSEMHMTIVMSNDDTFISEVASLAIDGFQIVDADPISSITEDTFNESYEVYPNPSNDAFYLKSIEPIRENINITVIDTYGKIILNKHLDSIDGRWEFGRHLPQGIYFVQIRNNNISTGIKKSLNYK